MPRWNPEDEVVGAESKCPSCSAVVVTALAVAQCWVAVCPRCGCTYNRETGRTMGKLATKDKMKL